MWCYKWHAHTHLYKELDRIRDVLYVYCHRHAVLTLMDVNRISPYFVAISLATYCCVCAMHCFATNFSSHCVSLFNFYGGPIVQMTLSHLLHRIFSAMCIVVCTCFQ